MKPAQVPRQQSSLQLRAVWGMLLCSVLLTLGCGAKSDPIAQIRALVKSGDIERASSIAKSIPKESTAWPEAQFLLGRIETSREGAEVGLHYYNSVPRDGSPISLKAAASSAEFEFHGCQLSAAVVNAEYLVQQSPADVALRGRLAGMLVSSGQRLRAEIHLFEILKKGKVPFKELVWLTAPERQPDPDPYLVKCGQMNSRDPYVQLGIAAEEQRLQKLLEAKRRIVELLQLDPGLADAQALMGELCLDAGLSELESWHAAIPARMPQHPGIWYVRGLWARRINQPRVAARCFWETIRLSPTHQRAMYQLGQLLTPLDPPAGAAFAERAQQLKDYGDVMETVLIQHGRDRHPFQRMVALLLEMGRDWEAWAWATSAVEMSGKSGWPAELLDSLSHVPSANPPRTKPDRDVALLHDLSDWPGFESLQSSIQHELQSPVPEHPLVSLRFEDQSVALGVDFTYFQSHSQETRGVRMFESTGGGVGVIDFDLDGWPDLFLTQGVEWPLGADRPVSSGQYLDRLFRNRSDRFEDVTILSCPSGEVGYGQGCSVGDFDNDGFPDLYVANIGANQLVQNNGDGTFSDVSRSASIEGEAWTTSCLIADLNGDGNPDLFDVNYLQGEHIFSIECSANRCSVRNYEGAPDQVRLSRGDGTFETIPDATPPTNAKGLGIVLVDIENEPLPRLFIANDQVPNFFLRPTSSEGQYVDDGRSSGLAVNMYGQPTACMGVAAADVNHDGMLDLFVTNFEGEANNLYLQKDHGIFEDAIYGSGLMAAGIPYVGWGTQFLDADNDGELDLVVANGHIADFHEPGVEYRMPLQFFRSTGPVRFEQVQGLDVGPLFERKIFGRSLAIFDWNRDGRMDFIVSCIDSPAIVATGLCPSPQHWLDVRLHARSTARDAIGTVVDVYVGSKISSRRLTAGDGYQASNQRTLHFGLGGADSVDRLVVRWPSGSISDFGRASTDATYHLIEGAQFAIEENQP